MLNTCKAVRVNIVPISEGEFENVKAEATSAVGHPDTADILGVRCNRMSLKLAKGDELFVAQLTGGRLPEGCTTLPEGFSFTFLKVTLD